MIVVNKLTREYRQRFNSDNHLGIFDVSLNVDDKECVALVGQNGSGKSTLLKCISGIMCPDSGGVYLDGRDAYKLRTQLCYEWGVLFSSKPTFIDDLAVADNLKLIQRLYNMQQAEVTTNMAVADSFLGIYELQERQYRTLSFGQRSRCEVVACLIHDPKYILLDEPTLGIDAGYLQGLKRYIIHLMNKNNANVIIVSHDFDFLNALCSRAVVMKDGRVIKDIKYADFYNIINRRKRVTVTLNEEAQIPDLLNKIEGFETVDSNHISFYKDGYKPYSEELMKWLTGPDVLSVDTSYRGIEEVVHEEGWG